MPAGRPSKYTKKLADEICARLACGESLRSICRDDHVPAKYTVLRWLFDDRYMEFRSQYERAREIQAEVLAEEITDIADDGTNDWMERLDKDGKPIGWQLNGEHVQRSRLRVDSRKWVASKLLPKKYGDRHKHEVTGADGKDLFANVLSEIQADEGTRLPKPVDE